MKEDNIHHVLRVKAALWVPLGESEYQEERREQEASARPPAGQTALRLCRETSGSKMKRESDRATVTKEQKIRCTTRRDLASRVGAHTSRKSLIWLVAGARYARLECHASSRCAFAEAELPRRGPPLKLARR